MPQFDFTTIFSVIASVGLCWGVYYSFFSINLLSEVAILNKFRNKLYKQNTFNKIKNVVLPSIFLYKVLVKKQQKIA